MSTQQQQSQQQQGAQRSSLYSQGKKKVMNTRPERLLTCMRIVNIVLTICVIASSAAVMAEVNTCGDCTVLSYGVVCFLTITFAVLLLLFELRLGGTYKNFMEKNFGFMYAHRGKATLIIFIGTLCFSSMNTQLNWWYFNLLVGLVVTLNGIFLCALYYCHPTFREVDLRPQSKGLGGMPVQGQGRSATASNGAAAQGAAANGSDYQYGDTSANTGPAYGRYNESPFVISEASPQPPPMEENPYSQSVGTSGMPFANTTATQQQTTSDVGGPGNAYESTQPSNVGNPFESNANPFSEDSDQRV